MLKSVVQTAADLEKADHRKQADEKAATWLVKQAKEAELVMDDDLKHEVQSKLAGSKRKKKGAAAGGPEDMAEFDENTDKPLFKQHDEDKFKERNRGQQRLQALKKTYDK